MMTSLDAVLTPDYWRFVAKTPATRRTASAAAADTADMAAYSAAASAADTAAAYIDATAEA